MLLNSQKNENNIIFYSVRVSDFEDLDFKDDALAGVRANYFNSNFSVQNEITDVEINSNKYTLSYNMNNSSPLSWKVMRDNRLYQSVQNETDGLYCVLYFDESENIWKKVYFDNNHNWLKTEYYDKSDKPVCRIYPDYKGKEIRLRLERNFNSGSKKNEYLYSINSMPTQKCTALAYTNSGMMWFDSSFRGECENTDAGKNTKNGFNFSEKSFDIKEKSEFDITKSDYLDESIFVCSEDKEYVLPESNENSTKNSVQGYSAYDMIQNILVEAQKTNNNLFGDVIDIQNVLENDEISSNESEYNIEAGSEKNSDSEIVTASGKYLYYGDLDEKGNRQGKGRTVSPNGLTAYEGEYKNNLKDGFGVGYYKTGGINYVGNWIENNRSGAGVGYRLSDGTMHAGKWFENKPDGYGARFDKDGNFIDICNYNFGTRNGKSISFDKDGNILITVWQNGEKMLEKVIQDGDLVE